MIEGDANVIAANQLELHRPGGDLACITCGGAWPCDSALLAIGYATAIRQRDAAAHHAENWRATAASAEEENLDRVGLTARLEVARNEVRRLHPPQRATIGKLGEQWSSTKGPGLFCWTCHQRWPCPTAEAIYTEEEVAREIGEGTENATVASGAVPGVESGGIVGLAGTNGGGVDGDGGNDTERCRSDE